MDSAFVTNERMLALITQQLNNVLDRVVPVNTTEAVGVCGFPCVGDCNTCEQSGRDLEAFYAPEAAAAPVEVVVHASDACASVEGGNSAVTIDMAEGPIEVHVMAYAGDDDGALDVARAMDALDEAQRSGEAYEYAEDEYRGCHCLDCLNHDDPDYRPYYDDEDDGGNGLDWNESGYFD